MHILVVPTIDGSLISLSPKNGRLGNSTNLSNAIAAMELVGEWYLRSWPNILINSRRERL